MSLSDLAATDMKKRFPDGIKRFGADCLRFALLRHNVTTMDINLDIAATAAECSKFGNKLWNLVAYAQLVWKACPPSEKSTLNQGEKDYLLFNDVFVRNKKSKLLQAFFSHFSVFKSF